MKNIRKFETVAEYEAWMSGDAVFPNVCYVAEDGRIAYNPPPPLPLYIEAIQNLTVKFGNTYEYSKDNVTWTAGTGSTSISAKAGERVFFRASGLTASSSSGIGTFTISNGNCNVGGNVMSMVYGADFDGRTEITQDYQFYNLFGTSQSYTPRIIDAGALVLPATSLTAYCYSAMFVYQSRLTVAPMLPATTLADKCYKDMFYGCCGLTDAPALPATTLAHECYYQMFGLCYSLTTAPELPATTLADKCYSYMFYNCDSLVNAPALPAITLAQNCYIAMFKGCTSLTTAPELPATTLVKSCYYYMFEGCSSLNYIKAMFTTAPSTNYMDGWVSGVSASGTFVKNSAAQWSNSFGTSKIPSGWTVELADA